MNIKLTIMYNGKRYQGWQRLGNDSKDLSIQGLLETAIESLLNEEVRLIGSGRTDAGVHAYGQVANFHTKKQVDLTTFRANLNAILPVDIQVKEAVEVFEQFHSRYSAVKKHYEYHIANGDHENVFCRETTLFIPKRLDIPLMKKAAGYLIGTHDFAGFSSKMPDGRPTVKTLSNIEITTKGDLVILSYEGDGFLYNMVRIMTGTLIEIGLHERPVESIQQILETKNRQLAGKTVEGKGLFLSKVVYLLQKT